MDLYAMPEGRCLSPISYRDSICTNRCWSSTAIGEGVPSSLLQQPESEPVCPTTTDFAIAVAMACLCVPARPVLCLTLACMQASTPSTVVIYLRDNAERSKSRLFFFYSLISKPPPVNVSFTRVTTPYIAFRFRLFATLLLHPLTSHQSIPFPSLFPFFLHSLCSVVPHPKSVLVYPAETVAKCHIP